MLISIYKLSILFLHNYLHLPLVSSCGSKPNVRSQNQSLVFGLVATESQVHVDNGCALEKTNAIKRGFSSGSMSPLTALRSQRAGFQLYSALWDVMTAAPCSS